MYASTISRVEGDEEAIRTLTWLGGSFFSNIRLAKFTVDTWSQVRSPEGVDWRDARECAKPSVEIWSILDDREMILGAMTLHFYSWNLLRHQQFFSGLAVDHGSEFDRVCVRRFERIVAGATGSIAPFDVAVELGYVAVARQARGHGLGRTLFDIFQHRATAIATGRALAFTIVMATHAHSNYGHSLMSHLIKRGARDQSSAVSWRALAATMDLPRDLFEIETAAYPTAWMAQQRGFSMAGYGKNLGQVWVRDMELAAQHCEALNVVPQPLLAMPDTRPLEIQPLIAVQ